MPNLLNHAKSGKFFEESLGVNTSSARKYCISFLLHLTVLRVGRWRSSGNVNFKETQVFELPLFHKAAHADKGILRRWSSANARDSLLLLWFSVFPISYFSYWLGEIFQEGKKKGLSSDRDTTFKSDLQRISLFSSKKIYVAEEFPV